jgi:hypothetical protein
MFHEVVVVRSLVDAVVRTAHDDRVRGSVRR